MKKTLFVTSNRLGDAVLTTGILQHLIKTEPDNKITVVCGKIPAPIFEAVEGVEKVVAISKRKKSLHWWDAFKEIDGFFWNRIVDFRGSPLGFLPTARRYLWKGGSDTEHKLVSNSKMIGEQQVIMPSIPVVFEQIPDHLKISKDRPLLAIAPTANFYQKQWHYENYLELARKLTSADGILPNARVLVLGAPGEDAQARPVVDGLPSDQVVDFVGKTDPYEAAQLLYQADLFVGNDSGLMHTAVAVDIPTVGLFGIGKPAVYKPYGEKSLCLIGEPKGEPVTRTETVNDDGTREVSETLPLDYVLGEVTEFYKKLTT
ncbi:glycosyltransferase family 9 protein [Sneathiella sp. P13V-1]|uniref:glycosyltransferase family 9 protein n=1 Tax=Sneathiella sp. P13V-1 TaxID=2697366 RepID=UPI00187B81E6|nr:glycosyltransferase family 9 protein [Sneathiella sp. P13V-1]MBE7637746.1 glycosyltransferase family 9 protein [Sneathiella sp. P13V-1]